MLNSAKLPNESSTLEKTDTSEPEKSKMSESKELLEDKASEKESDNYQSNEELDTLSKEGSSLSESKSSDEESKDPREALIKTEVEVLAKQEELVERLVKIEKEIEEQSVLLPCKSCEFPDPITETAETTCCGLCRRTFSRYGGLREFWIVSAPGDTTPLETFDKLNVATQNKHLSKNYKFHIPQLRIGSMDDILELIDELLRLDSHSEETLKRLVSFMLVIIGNSGNAMEHLLINNMDVATYITRFTWNSEKYPIKMPLQEIFESIKEEIKDISTELQVRSEEVGYLETTLQKIKRDGMGNLLTRPLDGIVSKKHLILNSDFLTTLLVVVTNDNKKKWLEKYETLIDMVVPQSSVQLFSDDTHSLFTVVIAKKFVADFEKAAKDHKFTVRRFKFSEKKMLEDEFTQKLKKIREALFDVAYRWIKVNFNLCFVCWMHIKALRVFAESVIRFGLPVNFQATILIPLKSKKLKIVLDDLYRHIENKFAPGVDDDIPTELEFYKVAKYFPYVFVTITSDFRDTKDNE